MFSEYCDLEISASPTVSPISPLDHKQESFPGVTVITFYAKVQLRPQINCDIFSKDNDARKICVVVDGGGRVIATVYCIVHSERTAKLMAFTVLLT